MREELERSEKSETINMKKCKSPFNLKHGMWMTKTLINCIFGLRNPREVMILAD